MAAQAILASGFSFYVNNTIINGVKQFTPGYGNSEADTTVFTNGGNKSHLVSGREKTVKVEGYHYEDPDTGTRDAGQLAVEALNELVGTSAFGTLKIISPGGNEKEFNGTFKLSDGGGGNDDATAWGFEFKRSGADVN